jgi:hypothetical protein
MRRFGEVDSYKTFECAYKCQLLGKIHRSLSRSAPAEESAMPTNEAHRQTICLKRSVPSVEIHCPDVSLWELFNAIYRTFFTGPLPPRAFIGSGPLLFGARFDSRVSG